MITFISIAGGMLVAFLIFGALAVMYSYLSSYQLRMMERLRRMKYQIDDLEKTLENQDERLLEIRQYLSKIESEKAQPPRSTDARPSGLPAISGGSSRARSMRGL